MIHMMYPAHRPLILGAPGKRKPVLVRAECMFHGLRKGDEAWVAGHDVNDELAAGRIVRLEAPLDPEPEPHEPIPAKPRKARQKTAVAVTEAVGEVSAPTEPTPVVEPQEPAETPLDTGI